MLSTKKINSTEFVFPNVQFPGAAAPSVYMDAVYTELNLQKFIFLLFKHYGIYFFLRTSLKREHRLLLDLWYYKTYFYLENFVQAVPLADQYAVWMQVAGAANINPKPMKVVLVSKAKRNPRVWLKRRKYVVKCVKKKQQKYTRRWKKVYRNFYKIGRLLGRSWHFRLRLRKRRKKGKRKQLLTKLLRKGGVLKARRKGRSLYLRQVLRVFKRFPVSRAMRTVLGLMDWFFIYEKKWMLHALYRTGILTGTRAAQIPRKKLLRARFAKKSRRLRSSLGILGSRRASRCLFYKPRRRRLFYVKKKRTYSLKLRKPQLFFQSAVWKQFQMAETVDVRFQSLWRVVQSLPNFVGELQRIWYKTHYLRKSEWIFDALVFLNSALCLYNFTFLLPFFVIHLFLELKHFWFFSQISKMLETIYIYKKNLQGAVMVVSGAFDRHGRSRTKRFDAGYIVRNSYQVRLVYDMVHCPTFYGLFSVKFWLYFRTDTYVKRYRSAHSDA